MRRERLLPWLMVILLACCSYTHVDEREVRSQAAAQMDCDEALLKIENLGSGRDDVARYGVRGCGQSKTYDCSQETAGARVLCSPMKRPESSSGESGEVAGSVAAAAAGCACASLLGGGKSSSAPATTQPSPMRSTPTK